MSAANSARTIVGFVGLGQMGKPMALNLLHADTDLRVTSKVQDAYPDLLAAGATAAGSLAGIADSHIVFLSLPGTAAVMDVLFGDNGLTNLLRPGSIVVDTSTMEHGATLDIHSRLAAANIAFLDAPVSKIVESPDYRRKIEEQGAFAAYMDPSSLDKFVSQELASWAKVIKEGNITAE